MPLACSVAGRPRVSTAVVGVASKLQADTVDAISQAWPRSRLETALKAHPLTFTPLMSLLPLWHPRWSMVGTNSWTPEVALLTSGTRTPTRVVGTRRQSYFLQNRSQLRRAFPPRSPYRKYGPRSRCASTRRTSSARGPAKAMAVSCECSIIIPVMITSTTLKQRPSTRCRTSLRNRLRSSQHFHLGAASCRPGSRSCRLLQLRRGRTR